MAQQNMNAVFYATTYHPIQAGSIDGTDTTSHDNGIYRALLASSTGLYDPTGDPKAEGDPYCTLFVGRLALHTTEKTLHEVMSNYGRVKHLRLVRHIVTRVSCGYAFVEFESENDMQNAYEVAQHHIIDGSSILVDYNRQHLMTGWIPRRLGGGLGGRKESGQLRFGGRDRPFRAPLRTIPSEQLKKLGIPLPPVGRYMSRFQRPPIPRRPGSSKEGDHHKEKSFHRRSPFLETLPSKSVSEDEIAEVEQRGGFSSRLGRRSVDAERGSSTQEEHRSRHRAEREIEENVSDKLDRGRENVRQHRTRKHSEQEDDEKSTRSGHDDRESRRYRDQGHEYGKGHRKRSLSEQVEEKVEHETFTGSRHEDRESSQNRDGGHEYVKERKRSHSEQGDELVDYEKVTRSGHEDRESSRYHKRSKSRSGHKQTNSGDYETSSSRSGHRNGGHRHKRHRSTSSKNTAEDDRSPKRGSEHSRRSESKHRRRDH